MDKKPPLVSVIIPIYNAEKYISKAVDSVINQTYRNLEIVLVDDGSSDNCGNICDGYAVNDSRISVIHKKNGGVSSARNTGINAANGDWICFVDSDDWIEPSAIEKSLLSAIENNCEMCIFDFDIVNHNSVVNKDSLKINGTAFTELSDTDLFLAYACALGSIWNIITKAAVIKRLKFDESISFREDEIFRWQLYGSIKSFCYIREVLYHYRANSLSAVNSQTLFGFISGNAYVYRKCLEFTESGIYPFNAEKAVHSKYLESFFSVTSVIFKLEKTLGEKIKLYNEYVNGKEFKESICDFTDMYFSKALKLSLKGGKAPHWSAAYLLAAARNLKLRLSKRF